MYYVKAELQQDLRILKTKSENVQDIMANHLLWQPITNFSQWGRWGCHFLDHEKCIIHSTFLSLQIPVCDILRAVHFGGVFFIVFTNCIVDEVQFSFCHDFLFTTDRSGSGGGGRVNPLTPPPSWLRPWYYQELSLI